ncbi:MAG: MFS transporter [Acidiferrobacteraceae bacterium]
MLRTSDIAPKPALRAGTQARRAASTGAPVARLGHAGLGLGHGHIRAPVAVAAGHKGCPRARAQGRLGGREVSSLAPAALLVFIERLGKGLRNPPRDTLLAQAGNELGHGRVFGIHELLDQTGALVGPLLVAGAVAYGGYRLGFALLIVPAVLALIMLLRAHTLTPVPKTAPGPSAAGPMPQAYRRYLAFSALTVMGFAHFILVSYDFALTHRLPPVGIPLVFGLAMGADALAALAAGHLFDRVGFNVLFGLPVLIIAATPLLFLTHSYALIALGAALWGAAMGLQESVMRAGVARLSPDNHRGRAFGLFDATFGFAWMVGSVIMGMLYRLGPFDIVVFVTVLQILAVPLLLWTLRSVPGPRMT